MYIQAISIHIRTPTCCDYWNTLINFFYSVLIIFTAGNVYIFVTRQEIYEYLGNFWDPSGIVVIKFHVVKTRSILYRMNRSIDSRVKLV